MGLSVIAAGTAAVLSGDPSRPQVDRTRSAGVREVAGVHREVPNDPWMPRPAGKPAGTTEHCGPWVHNGFQSIQVNVDANGCNILGDAANEPSIAIDAVNPNNIVIGWRQFDSVLSDFRQAGYGYSHDGGQAWTFPGVLEPGVFGSDPVLGADSEGNFYYYSLQPYRGPSDWQCYTSRG